MRKTWESEFMPGLPIFAIEAQNEWVAGNEQSSNGYDTRVLGTGVEIRAAIGGAGGNGGAGEGGDGDDKRGFFSEVSKPAERGSGFFRTPGYVTLGRHR